MKLSRRTLLRSGAAALVVPAAAIDPLGLPGAARADEKSWRHGLSLFGDLKYPARASSTSTTSMRRRRRAAWSRQIAIGTFDNFNIVVSGVKGSIAGGIDLVYDTLNVPALDEVSTEYGLLAESVSYPADYSSVTYRLRAEAKWHDGKPVTPDDVIFSLDAYRRKSSAAFRLLPPRHQGGEDRRARHHVHVRRPGQSRTAADRRPAQRAAEALVGGDRRIRQEARRRRRRRSSRSLGGGAYRIKDFVAGRTVVFERVKDYWGRDLNVNIGRDNFDELRFEYFRDSTVAIEAFKGDMVDWRTENSAKNWATAYDFPAVKDKRVVLEEFPIRSSGAMQAFAFNTRRDKFKDPRVRLAMNYAFDFEEMNKQIFFGQYKRIASYFEGTELAATGLPEGQELEILQSVRDKVPAEVFTKPYTNPVGGTPENVRSNLRESLRLLQRGRLRGAQPEARERRRPASSSRSSFSSPIRTPSGSCCSTSPRSNGSAWRSRCAPSMTRNTSTASAAGISTSSPGCGASRFRPATSSVATGVRKPPIRPARAISSASRTRRSMR